MRDGPPLEWWQAASATAKTEWRKWRSESTHTCKVHARVVTGVRVATLIRVRVSKWATQIHTPTLGVWWESARLFRWCVAMETSACPSDGSFESVQSLVEEGKTTREALESVAAEMDLTPTALRGR